MRLTYPLQALHRGPLIKRVWKYRGRYSEPNRVIAKPLLAKGVEIVDPTEKPTLPLWKPPVKDDPRWWKPPPIEQLENYHEDPIYLCYQKSRLLEGTKQAQILTKSQCFMGLPPNVKKMVGKVTIPNQDLLVQRYIMQSQIWHTDQLKQHKRIEKLKPGFRFKTEYGTFPQKSAEILLLNLLRLCQSQSKQYPAILTDRKLVRKVFVRSHINHGDKAIQIAGTNAALLLTKRPLANFAAEDVIDTSTSYVLPDIYPVAPTIDLAQVHIYRTDQTSGFINQPTDQHPHTLFVIHANYWKTDQQTANSLLYLFAYAANEARRRFGVNVQTLPKPINVQCVHMDFRNLNFLSLQLNTLNFQNGDGVKNLVWIDQNNNMFDKELCRPWLGMEHRVPKYLNYNSEVFPKFLAVYLNGLYDDS